MPTAQDFGPEAVNRAVRKEALQHPLTLLPAAGAGVGILSILAFGVTPVGALVTLALGFVAATSWGFHYILTGEQRAAKYVARLREKRMQLQRHEVERIEEDCDGAGFALGAKEARELTEAYAKLVAFLERGLEENGGYERTQFRVLAEDAYREGVGILRQALSIFAALRGIDVEKLERELAAWQLQSSRTNAGDKQALASQMSTHQKRIEAYRQREERLSQLIAESNRLEGALETTYLQAAELAGREGSRSLVTGGAAAELERAVGAARKTEERLRELEGGSTGADQTYLDAATTTKKSIT